MFIIIYIYTHEIILNLMNQNLFETEGDTNRQNSKKDPFILSISFKNLKKKDIFGFYTY